MGEGARGRMTDAETRRRGDSVSGSMGVAVVIASDPI